MPVYYHTGGGFIGIEMAEQLKGLGLEAIELARMGRETGAAQ